MKNQAAVDIAKDVLKQINAKTLIARKGSYVHAYTHMKGRERRWIDPIYGTDTLNKRDAREALLDKELGMDCEVCALGAVFMSWVKKNNSVTLEEIGTIHASGIIEKLKDVFSNVELCVMECVFERRWATQLPDSISLDVRRKFMSTEYRTRNRAYHDKYMFGDLSSGGASW